MTARHLKMSLLSFASGLLAFVISYYSYGWDRFRTVDFRIPFDYWGDCLISLPSIKAIISEDWWPFGIVRSARAGAPFGMDWGDWPQAENVHFMMFKILGLLSKDPAVVLNLFYALSSVAIAASMCFVLRRQRVQPALAVAGGIIYSLLPFHYLRYHHILLSNYFLLPFTLHYCLRLGRSQTLFQRRQKFSWQEFAGFAFFSFLLAGCGIYYAFFSCFALFVCGLTAALARRKSKTLRSTFAALAVVSFFVALNLAPHIIYSATHGANLAVGVRSAGDTEYYSLRLLNMITPPKDHVWNFALTLREKFPPPIIAFEGVGEYIGFLAILGSALALFGPLARRKSGLRAELGLLWICCFALGAYGGFGAVFNSLVSAGIRCYNRLSPLMAGIGLMVLIVVLSQSLTRLMARLQVRHLLRNLVSTLIALGLVAFAVSDQVGTTMKSLRPWDRYLSDQEFVRHLERDYPQVNQVLQLPFITFPEAGNVEKMPDFAHFVGYTNSDRLRWSYGVMKNRPGEATIQALSKLPLDLSAIRALGYDGIYVDRAGYADEGKSVIDDLRQKVTTRESVSADQRLIFFSLK